MASAVAAYNLAFGADSPPASYADIEEANTFLILGANIEACHPILFDRIKARKRADRDGVKVIVVDPRRTRTAEIADIHLPVLPGTDVALLLSLLYEVRLAGGLDASFIEERTNDWAALDAALAGWSAERASSATGLDAQEIVDAAGIIAGNGPMLSLWTMGANQSTSGVDKNLALINLSLATGNIGKPGAGPFSLTGQPNAMGGRETGRLADVLLPAAQWSERPGTMTNSERRSCLLEQIGEPPGLALPDWRIICRVAEALGHGDAFDYEDTEAIFDEYRELTRGRDLDITGLDYELLRESSAGVQWPYPEATVVDAATGEVARSPRLFGAGRFPTPDGRARFHVPSFQPPADTLSDEYPLALLTGRVKDQWHTMTRTGKVPKLMRSERVPFLEMHPADAGGIGVRDEQRVRVTSRRGSLEVQARLTDRIRPGAVFAPFHWGELWSRHSVTNNSTSDAIDPRSKQPELKFAAVRVEPILA